MSRLRAILAVAAIPVLLVSIGCGPGSGTDHQASAEPATDDGVHDHAKQLVVTIEPKNDSGVSGTATFVEDQGTVTLVIEIAGATPGEHAFHLHEIGDCSAPDGTSAGGHWNPTEMAHGKWGAESYHLGDVGNIVVGDDGHGSYRMESAVWNIGGGGAGDIVGRAVIVHAGVDDFTTQPTGAAGGRIGCGVIG